MCFFIYQNFLWVTQLFNSCTVFRCSLDLNSCTPGKSHQHLGVHTQTPHRLGYLLKPQPPSLFTNWCFPIKMSLAMDHLSRTLVPTELDLLITAEKLHRLLPISGFTNSISQGIRVATMLILLKAGDELLYLTGNRSSNLNMTIT